MKRICTLFLVIVAGLRNPCARAVDNTSPPASGNTKITERFLDIFQPFRTTTAALSPDGKCLAYSVREGEKTWVVTVDLANPSVLKGAVVVGTDDAANAMFSENDEKIPLLVLWLGWVTSNRLVIMTNQAAIYTQAALWRTLEAPEPSSLSDTDWLNTQFAQDRLARLDSAAGWTSTSGTIFSMDADGKNGRMLLNGYSLSLEIPNADPFFGRSTPTEQPYAMPQAPMGLAHVVAPNIFDYSSDNPECLIIRAQVNGRGNYFCELNAISGKVELLNNDYASRGYLPLYDRQRHLRIGLEAEPSSYPISYLLHKEGFTLGHWKKLDDAVQVPGKTRFSLSPENFFTERSFPLGFDENASILFYASNVGRDTYGIFGYDLKTNQPTDFAIESPGIDLVAAPSSNYANANLVFDRFSRSLVGVRYLDTSRQTAIWIKPELTRAQKALEARFPLHNVEIVEWDKTFSEILALIHNAADAGSFIIYNPEKNSAVDLVRRSPLMETRPTHRVMPFSLNAPEGNKINGLLTFPVSGRFDKVPIVVRCPIQPWLRTSLTFQPETIALADMGFAVLQIDSRGAWGFGVKRRESIKDGYEKTIVADAVYAIENLSKTYRINPQRVALLGEGYGGYVALRALQLEPDRFRCAVTINAPLDLYSWIENDRWTRRSKAVYLTRAYYGPRDLLKESALDRHPEKITKPVCLLAWPGPEGAPRTPTYLETRQFAYALRRQGTPVELNELDKRFTGSVDNIEGAPSAKSTMLELDREFTQRLPHAQAAAYRHIEYFLNAYIYDYQVKLGPLKELPDPSN
ncbi:MAG: prolyl oligopeptidase family serine peptidase [Nibricoccus sp.]